MRSSSVRIVALPGSKYCVLRRLARRWVELVLGTFHSSFVATPASLWKQPAQYPHLRLATASKMAPSTYTRARATSLAMCALLLATTFECWAQRPPRTIPATSDTVLERLPRGYAALEPQLGAQAAPLVRANVMLAAAARTGDARLAARAEQILDDIPKDRHTVEVREAKAFAAQHRHAFDLAASLLSQVIEERPRDASAHLSRAQVRLVQGDLQGARADCTALILGIDSDAGMLCLASLTQRQGRYAESADLLDQWLAQPAPDRQALRYALVMRSEVASRGGAQDAGMWFRRALKLDPLDVRTIAAYARHLRSRGQYQAALKLLTRAPTTDALQLQLALAAQALGTPDAKRLADAQGRRYALAHAVGTSPELRDEAEFALSLRSDPKTALALAQRNYATQRDVEDVDILVRAAKAADRQDIVARVDAWTKRQEIQVPRGPTK